MKVVGHQRVSVNVSFVLRGGSAEDRQKTFVVRQREEDVTTVDTSLNHVVRYPWGLQSTSARHVGQGVHEPSQWRELRFPPNLGVCSVRAFKS